VIGLARPRSLQSVVVIVPAMLGVGRVRGVGLG